MYNYIHMYCRSLLWQNHTISFIFWLTVFLQCTYMYMYVYIIWSINFTIWICTSLFPSHPPLASVLHPVAPYPTPLWHQPSVAAVAVVPSTPTPLSTRSLAVAPWKACLSSRKPVWLLPMPGSAPCANESPTSFRRTWSPCVLLSWRHVASGYRPTCPATWYPALFLLWPSECVCNSI